MSAQRISPVQAMEVHGDSGGCLNLHAWIVESGQMEQALYQALQVFGVPEVMMICLRWWPSASRSSSPRIRTPKSWPILIAA
ncbi:ubiquinone biosynthesis hydroxylase family protein [Alcaligenes faecalis subsp. faecalis NCIB 8687]|nr:ubiquinone biosynthesis hydroxylase family protein [Alcaligenes faecalis subsp. faecalis NCIB 8687]